VRALAERGLRDLVSDQAARDDRAVPPLARRTLRRRRAGGRTAAARGQLAAAPWRLRRRDREPALAVRRGDAAVAARARRPAVTRATCALATAVAGRQLNVRDVRRRRPRNGTSPPAVRHNRDDILAPFPCGEHRWNCARPCPACALQA